jgi:hypothetical protein
VNRDDTFPRVAALAPHVGCYFYDKTTVAQAVDIYTVFNHIYGYEYKSGDYESSFRMIVLKRTFAYCRRNMYPFIVPIEVNGEIEYFVPTTRAGMKYYEQILRQAQMGIGRTLVTRIPKWLKIAKATLKEIRAGCPPREGKRWF